MEIVYAVVLVETNGTDGAGTIVQLLVPRVTVSWATKENPMLCQ